MILAIENVLNQDEIEYLRNLYYELEPEPGEKTAAGDLKKVKDNHQLQLAERAPEVRQRLIDALNRTSALTYALIPKTVSLPLLNRYQPGMAYGHHTDAHFGQTNRGYFRCDISCTIFLDEPASYEGGELEISTDHGLRSYKLKPGWGVFYPTQYIHQVKEVTRGERRAVVFWFESFVRDPQKRWMLYELQQLRAWIETAEPVTSEPRQKLVNLCENLHRMWVEN